MKKYHFYWLIILVFTFPPVFAYAEEAMTAQVKSATVTEIFAYAEEAMTEQVKSATAAEPVVQQNAMTEQEKSAAGAEPVVEQKAVTESDEKKPAAISEPPVEQEAENGEMTEEVRIVDPFEPWNRVMFAFNDKFYFWVLKPAATGYSAIVPEWGRVRVRNMFHNIAMPVRAVNNLLQLNIRGAGTEVLRFVFNTTVGVAGMFDVAKNIDLKESDKDLGQTLGVYGLGNGFYIVWPIIGPSSLRDTAGLAGDFFLDPVNYITPTRNLIAIRSWDYTNRTSLHIGDYEDLKESALDPYISFKNAYIQYRNNKVKENNNVENTEENAVRSYYPPK